MDVSGNSKKRAETPSKDRSSKKYETRSRTGHTSKINKFDEFKKQLVKKGLKRDVRKEEDEKNGQKKKDEKKEPKREKEKPRKTELKIKNVQAEKGETRSSKVESKKEVRKKLSKTESKIKRREKNTRGSREEEEDKWYRERPQYRQTTLEEIVGTKTRKSDSPKKKLKSNDENHNPYTNKTIKLTAEEEEMLFKKRLEEDDYKKYGKKTPSFDEIVKHSKELETYKNKVKTACAFAALNKVQNISTSQHDESEVKLLECKHLSLEEIGECFRENKAFCKNIIDGESGSKRHEQYNKLWPHCSPLTYNTSMATFTSVQIQRLVKLCERKFKSCTAEYFFMVLLPELCLKIFCDLHKMSPEEGEDYLQKRPVDDII